MNKWAIEYWTSSTGKSQIDKWLDSLSEEQFKSVSKEIKMLEKIGNELKLPHSRALGESLFELRERRFGYRIYYTFRNKNIIILLTAGDKKSQANDIRVARQRLLRGWEKK